MDAGARVAAFIGLVGLVAQSTTSLIQLIKDIRDTPGTHRSNLKWLEQLSCVLKDLQNTGSTLQKANLAIDLSTLEEYLRDFRKAIDILRAHLEKKLSSLNSTGLEKRKAVLKSYFGTRSADCQIQNIRRAMEGLILCHSSIVGQIVVQSHRSIEELTAQTNYLTLGTQDIRRDFQQLQHATLGTLQGVQNLEAAQDWMAAVQGVLPLEIRNLVRNAITEELRSASQDRQTLSNEAIRKQTLSLNPGIQNVLPLERPGMVPTSPKLDITSDHQSLEQFQEMEKDFLLPYQNRNEDYTTSPSKMQGQRSYIKSKILMFSWYYRAFFGYFSVMVSERHQVTAGREENVIHVEVKIFPWRWVSSRGFQARILYDRTHGLSSPTNIQLDFPRIIRCVSTDDGIWSFFHERKSDLIIDNIRSGVYHPNDLVENIELSNFASKEFNMNWTGPISLLTIASLFGDIEVVRFLLQQGARVDQSGKLSFALRRNPLRKSDLHYALAPVFWWSTETIERPDIVWMNLIAMEARLDTARLLINAGSDTDSVTIPILLIWAIEWDLETIFSVVGNDDNFHWDVIPQDIRSLDWYMAFASLGAFSDDLLAWQARFEKFFKLCKRLKIDLAFTQANGFTSLHWMIEHSFDLKHCLSVLVSNGADPCAVCDGYLTPTLVSFFQSTLDSWFTVLRLSGISVEAVAAHAVGLLVESIMCHIIIRMALEPIDHIFESSHISTIEWLFKWLTSQDKCWAVFEAIKQLRAALIEAFEHQGCYLNESGDRGKMITYKASSSVDFRPSTVYDPERAKLDFRRRTGAQKNPQ